MNDWPTMQRDYIHIIDLAKGHIQALKLLNKTESTEISINLIEIKIFENTSN